MKYEVTYSKRPVRKARFITRDSVVIWATPTLSWALGKSFETVAAWCDYHYIHWHMIGLDFAPPEVKRACSPA